MRKKILIIVFLFSSILISATGKTLSGYYTSSGSSVAVTPNSIIIEARYDAYQQEMLLKQQLLEQKLLEEQLLEQQQLALEQQLPLAEQDGNTTVADGSIADIKGSESTEAVENDGNQQKSGNESVADENTDDILGQPNDPMDIPAEAADTSPEDADNPNEEVVELEDKESNLDEEDDISENTETNLDEEEDTFEDTENSPDEEEFNPEILTDIE